MNSVVFCILIVAIACDVALGQITLPRNSPLGQQCAVNANGRTFTATAATTWPCQGTCTYSDGETNGVMVANNQPCSPVGILPTGICQAGCCIVFGVVPSC
uniref:U15-Hexatoxin-Hc1c_1 n=1 Tax=Hadronyche cerberea TaxID=1107879 RepID=A0A4Q8K8P7_HADCE